ncbi:hypothetical protein [Streptomyces triculaminicus]|uniref:hypothetical protein n=1 Tax=Streptomyces triculaminicus TaxID=2816232 RepID=UPI0037AAC67B
MTDRIRLDELTSNDLDQLYDQLDTLRTNHAEDTHTLAEMRASLQHTRAQLSAAWDIAHRLYGAIDHPAVIDLAELLGLDQ